MGLTDDPQDPRLGVPRRDGQNEAYLVLSEEERKQGFVRPVRRTYIHVGQSVCGKPGLEDQLEELPDGYVAYLCTGLPGHDDDCCTWRPVTSALLARFKETGFFGGCDRPTTMAQELAETYARHPAFYGATFCCTCRDHLAVGVFGEFVWADEAGGITLERVGT